MIFITISSTTGNATDFGDCISNTEWCMGGGASNATRGIDLVVDITSNTYTIEFL